MSQNAIVFPGLGISMDPSRVAFYLGDSPIYWYGIIIAGGFLLAVLYGMVRCRQFGMSQDHLLDGLLLCTPVAVVAARLYYVVFQWDYFKEDLMRIFYIREGGLAIYGAIIGVVVCCFFFARAKKLSFLAVMDLASIGVILGQGIGRWANFINREAHGGVTDLPWRMEIFVAEEGQRLCVHPTFLYESLWCLLGFLVLHLLSKHRKFDGQVFFTYVAWYGIGRGFIEGLRTDSLYLIPGVVRVSQALGFVSAAVAIGLLVYYFRKKEKKLTPAYGTLQEERKMTATILDGKLSAQRARDAIAQEVARLKEQGLCPGLAVVLVGSDPASQVYVRNKKRDCEQCGIESFSHTLPEETTQQELLELIARLNRDPAVHGILVQLPLPAHLDEKEVLRAIDPRKDVDAFHPENVGKIMIGDYDFLPCTPAGVMQLLDEYGIDPAGKECVVVGRSNIVGKPMAMLLLHRHGTVTICHSRTRDLAEITRRADILVAAVGKTGLITGEMIKPGAVVIDVAINRCQDGKLRGDVVFEEAAQKASFLTPVPGGVGPMTRVMLLKNTLTAAKLASGME